MAKKPAARKPAAKKPAAKPAAKKPSSARKPAAKKPTARKTQGMSAGKMLSATKPFVFARALAYLVVIVMMVAAGALGLLLCYSLLQRGLTIAAVIVFIVIFFGFFGLLRLARRYFLYMIKAAHIAAITAYIKTGSAPVTKNGYRGVVAYGTEKIKANFKEANIAFVADALIAGASRQIMRWVNKVERLFSFIPGANMVMSFVNLILSTALNYIDEAVLSYVFYHNEEKNGFKKACDGLVYYAQSWKGMLKGAFKVAAFVWILRIVTFIIFYMVFVSIGQSLFASWASWAPRIADIFGVLLALIVVYGIEAIIVVPYATCVMIGEYYTAIKGQRLRSGLHGTLCKVSKKFRSLFEKSGRSRR